MNVTIRHRGLDFEVQIDNTNDGDTVADLVLAATGDTDQFVTIDDHVVAGTVPLRETGLRDGSFIEIADQSQQQRRGTLVHLTGPAQGTRHALYPGSISIGAVPADVPVAGATGQARLHTDSGGGFSLRNPERISVIVDGDEVAAAATVIVAGGRFQIGAVTFGVVAGLTAQPLRGGTFNRPPRPIVPRRVCLLEPPLPPKQLAKPMRFGWAALIVPVVLGVAMAVLIHPRMAMFAVFSPAMLLANWIEDKRRLRKERTEQGDVYRDLLGRFAGEVDRAYSGAVQDLHRVAVPPAEVALQAQRADARLWERRPDHEDFLSMPVGTGCIPWDPELSCPPAPEAKVILDRYAELHDVPISITLDPGDVTGIAGNRPRVLAVARQILLEAAVHHGPADLAISVFTERPSDWDWAKWLPHVVVDSSGRRRVAGTPDEIARVVALLPTDSTAPGAAIHHLCVVDLPDLSTGPRASIREALRAGKSLGISALAIASRPLDLPSLATTILSIEDVRSRIRFRDGSGTDLAPWQMGAATARATARALARIDDPEVATVGAGLPSVVHLETLLRLGDRPDRSIESSWRHRNAPLTAPIGVSAEGLLSIELVADGPHALLGGTTGAGKSELLRTLVASLAATASPTALNFVLVDYKGGSAFDACAAFPHTVGLVTDLDEHLAKRALTCLDAELRYREQRLRVSGISDIASFTPSDTEPLPRLLVVIDEFAALAKELPEFIDALVGIAQRGRSLGVHLLLATQRPNGVVSENIKANTNLRIALRVQDVADSVDVIGCNDAAAIGRNQPGRGLVRYGPRDVVPFQTAIVTGRSMSGHGGGIGVRPFVFSHEQLESGPAHVDTDDEPTDLDQIVAAAGRAAIALDLPAPRLPWPDALPEVLHLQDMDGDANDHGVAVFGLADEPHRQRQMAAMWSPAVGNLLLYGLPGSGTTTTLATLAVGLAENSDPDRLHIHVLDFDDQALHPLQSLPHVGAVVGANDRERQLRLLRRLAQELQNRRQAMATDPTALEGHPTIVTILDNYGGFADAFGEPSDMAIHNLLARLVADGPGVDMLTIMTAKHPGDIPTRIASLVASRLVFRLADRYDYSGLGVPPVEPPTAPGRAFESGSGREVQVALPHVDGLAAALGAIRWGAPVVSPWVTDILPSDVSVVDLVAASRISPREWFLPLGIGDTALTPAGLVLREGEHALITGPARSGKSTALATVAAAARAADPRLSIVAVLPRRSSLEGCSLVDDFIEPNDLARLLETDRPRLLVIDDAELVGENDFLNEMISSRHGAVKVVAAGSADTLRGLYGHWTQAIRRSRIGCALRPNLATDGDLWQTPLPRRGPEHFPVGRGYLLADGQTELVQLGRE